MIRHYEHIVPGYLWNYFKLAIDEVYKKPISITYVIEDGDYCIMTKMKKFKKCLAYALVDYRNAYHEQYGNQTK